MGQRTWRTSVDGGDHGGPALAQSGSGPQCISQGEHGGPVHHMMVGPRHEAKGVKQVKSLAQSRTLIVAVPVEMLKKKMERRGMDSDLFRFQIQSPSTHFQHHIYSFLHQQVEGVTDINARGMKGQVESIQWGRLEGVAQSKHLLEGLQLWHLSSCL